jgi:hypothetical protein
MRALWKLGYPRGQPCLLGRRYRNDRRSANGHAWSERNRSHFPAAGVAAPSRWITPIGPRAARTRWAPIRPDCDRTVNSGPKFAEIERFEIAARAHLAVDPLVANGSGTPCPVKAASRRRRGPTASLDGARRSAELGQRDRRRNATRSDNFKPMVLGEIHAAGDTVLHFS